MALNEKALLSDPNTPISEDLQTAEDIKFKSKSPFMTIISLTPGPLVHQVLSTGKSLIELMFIGHTCGNEGLTVYNSAFQFSNTLAHINGSPAGGTVVAVSSLIGKHQYSEAAQVVIDSFRITIPLSLIISIISYFIIIPFFKFLALEDKYMSETKLAVLPTLLMCSFIFIYNNMLEEVLAEGRSMVYAGMAVLRFVVCICIIDPILAHFAKCHVWMFDASDQAGTFVPGLLILLLLLCHKFSVKPEREQWCAKLSSETLLIYKIAASGLISFFISMLPSILLQRYYYKAATNIDQFTKYSVVYGPINLIRNFENAWAYGNLNGLGPAAAYSFATRDFERLKALIIASMFIPFTLYIVVNVIIYIKPSIMYGLFIKDKSILEGLTMFARTPFLLNILFPISVAAQNVLNSMKKPMAAVLPNIITSVVIVISVIILFKTGDGEHSPERILYCFPISDVAMALTSAVAFFIAWFRETKKNEEYERNEATQPTEATMVTIEEIKQLMNYSPISDE